MLVVRMLFFELGTSSFTNSVFYSHEHHRHHDCREIRD